MLENEVKLIEINNKISKLRKKREKLLIIKKDLQDDGSHISTINRKISEISEDFGALIRVSTANSTAQILNDAREPSQGNDDYVLSAIYSCQRELDVCEQQIAACNGEKSSVQKAIEAEKVEKQKKESDAGGGGAW